MFDPFDNPRRLSIPGFQKQEKHVIRQVVFPPKTLGASEWYRAFEARFFDALDNHRNLPIFRAGHGEYLFALGRRDPPDNWRSKVRFYLSQLKWSTRFLSTFYSGTPGYGHETYRQWQLPRLRRAFVEHLRWIAENGILCTYFSDRDACSLSYQRAFWAWLERHQVEVCPANYAHVYFVYGLFHGPRLREIVNGKRIIVVGSEMDTRKGLLEENLRDFGVRELLFIPISRSHAMLDQVIPPANFIPDLCLIGAGVGASNILYQLRALRCPCVDAGFVLDTLAWPEMRRRRIYCVSDELWEHYYPDDRPSWAGQFEDSESHLSQLPLE